jgi:glutamine amidotransferase
LLYASSEEDGGTPGLDLFSGCVRAFAGADAQRMLDPATGHPLKIPHMGWNQVQQTRPHPLWRGIGQDERFYFVHSYYAEGSAEDEVTGRSEYGIHFVSAAGRSNVFAVQFHPEKSQHAGLALLGNFAQWDGSTP